MPAARHIDDIIVRRQDSDHLDGGLDEAWYHVTDTLFSTVAILDDKAKLIERVSYDAYGNAHRVGDLDGDGATTSADAELSTDSEHGSYVNPEMHGSGLYTVRHRHYSPELGRWLTRDPIGYVDGMSLYEYVRGSPVLATDPVGLLTGLPIGPITLTPFDVKIPELLGWWWKSRLWPLNSVVCNGTSNPILVCHNGGCQILNPGACTDSVADEGDFWFIYPNWYKCGWATCTPTDADPGDGRTPVTPTRFYTPLDCHEYCAATFVPCSYSYLFCMSACAQ